MQTFLALMGVFVILAAAVAAGTYYVEPLDDEDPFSPEYYRKDD